MRVLLRDRLTGLFISKITDGIAESVKDRAQAHDFGHVPTALDESRAVAERHRLDVLMDFGDPQYDVVLSTAHAGRQLGMDRL